MSNTPARSRRRAICHAAARWVEHFLAVIGGLVLLYWLTIDVSTIVSPSMAPTLQGTSMADGDHLLTEKVTYWFRRPRRWEVITYSMPSGQKYVKRVVGLPGETVQLGEQGELLIDGQSVEQPPSLDVKYLRFGNLVAGKPVPCGQGYHVLGDYLRDSDDSRFEGPVSPQVVIGLRVAQGVALGTIWIRAVSRSMRDSHNVATAQTSSATAEDAVDRSERLRDNAGWRGKFSKATRGWKLGQDKGELIHGNTHRH